MTTQLIEAARQALEALEALIKKTGGQAIYSFMETERRIAMAACVGLREALEQPAQQEPVAWMVDVDLANYQGQSEYRTILAWKAKPVWSGTHEINEVLKAVPLYTSPPQRPWVGLTDEEVNKLVDDEDWYNDPHEFSRIVEAKVRGKNDAS